MSGQGVVNTVVELGAFESWLTDFDGAWLPENANEVADRLADNIETHYGPISDLKLSFDIFDTILLRRNTSEAERFFDVAAEFKKALKKRKISQMDVFLARLRSHNLSYQCTAHKDMTPEASIRGMFEGMLTTLGLPNKYIDTLLDVETVYETDMLYANPFLEVFLKKYYKGKTVQLISDMYLTHDQIDALVRHHWPKLKYTLDVSGTHNLSKRNGSLYDELLQKNKQKPHKILHMGDSLHSDVQMAKLHKVKALHLCVPRAIVQERKELKMAFEDKFNSEFGLELSDLK